MNLHRIGHASIVSGHGAREGAEEIPVTPPPYGYADSDEGMPEYADGEGGYGYGDGGYGYGYGYGYGEYVAWFPLAFDLTESGIEEYGDEDMAYYPSGTATFSGGVLNWTSTYSSWTIESAYADPYCGGYGYDTVDVDYGDDEAIAAPATGYVENETLPCTAYSIYYYYYDGGYYTDPYEVEDEDGEPTDDGDWGDEEEPGEPTSDPGVPEPDPVPDDEDTGDWDDDDDWGEDREGFSSEVVDVWTANLVAGESILITIDNLDAEATFDAYFIITDTETCMVLEADDEMVCTAGDVEWERCPGAEYIAETDGLHNIIVGGYSCDSEEASYQIGIDASTDPELTLIADDVEPYSMVPVVHTVTGTANITE